MVVKLNAEKIIDVFERVCKPWLMLFGEELARLLVSFAAVLALNAFLLISVKGAWSLYIETHVGDYFQRHFISLSHQLSLLVERPYFDLAADVTLFSFLLVIAVSALMQLTHFRHYLYMPFPFYVKLAWAAGLTAFVAGNLQAYVNLTDWTVAYAVMLPSVLCFLPVCLTVASHLVPDLATVSVRAAEWFYDKLSR